MPETGKTENNAKIISTDIIRGNAAPAVNPYEEYCRKNRAYIEALDIVRQKELLDVKDLALFMGNMGINKARDLMNSRYFPSFKLGGTMCVYQEDLRKWLSKMSNKEIKLNRSIFESEQKVYHISA